MGMVSDIEGAAGLARAAAAPALTGFMGYAIGALLLVLALSLGGNWVLWRSRDRAITAEAVAGERAGQNKAVATECSQGTEQLHQQAEQRREAAVPLQAEARLRSVAAAGQALQEIATPATQPGDDYRSAIERLQRWEAGREVRP